MSDAMIEKLVHVGGAILVLIIGFILVKVICKILRKVLEKGGHIDPALHTFILNTIKVALWIVLLVTTLGTLGVPIATFVTVLGAAGAAVALALKDSLSNFAGGILILINKPFSRGDYIKIGSDEGKVHEIDLLYTTLLTVDNKTIIMPNGMISNNALVNYSKEATRRVDCRFGISYDADIQQAKQILQVVTEPNPLIHQEPAPFIGVAEQADSYIAIDLWVWVDTADYWSVRYYLIEQVKLAFDEAGISIPYPQMDVHISH